MFVFSLRSYFKVWAVKQGRMKGNTWWFLVPCLPPCAKTLSGIILKNNSYNVIFFEFFNIDIKLDDDDYKEEHTYQISFLAFVNISSFFFYFVEKNII